MTQRSLQFRSHVKHSLALLLAIAAAPVAADDDVAVDAMAEELRPARGADVLKQVLLDEHNQSRVESGLAPLVWDEALVRDAEKWASHLAERKIFEHAPSKSGAAAQGENLWMGTRDAYAINEMAGMWLDERYITQSGVFPNVSSTGDWREVAHFTQMLWPSTRRLGCALASNAEDEVLVCRYFPAGNRIGDRFDVYSRK